MHLLLAGTVTISRRSHTLYSDFLEVSDNKDVSRLYNPKIDFRQKVVEVKGNGEFLEDDFLRLTGRRTESATVESEAALIIEIDLNLLLSMDRIFNQINIVQDVMHFKDKSRAEMAQKVKKTGLLGDAIEAEEKDEIPVVLIDIPSEAIPTAEDLNRRIKTGWSSYKEKEVKYGYNTLITRVGRSRDRSLADRSVENRRERQDFSENPLNYTSDFIGREGRGSSLKETKKNDSKVQGRALASSVVDRSRTPYAREQKNQREKERIERIVMDRMDKDEDINPICRLLLTLSKDRGGTDHQENIEQVSYLQEDFRRRCASLLG